MTTTLRIDGAATVRVMNAVADGYVVPLYNWAIYEFKTALEIGTITNAYHRKFRDEGFGATGKIMV